MFTVYFIDDPAQPESEAYIFISGIDSQSTAERIADQLKAEGFVVDAWADQD